MHIVYGPHGADITLEDATTIRLTDGRSFTGKPTTIRLDAMRSSCSITFAETCATDRLNRYRIKRDSGPVWESRQESVPLILEMIPGIVRETCRIVLASADWEHARIERERNRDIAKAKQTAKKLEKKRLDAAWLEFLKGTEDA